MDNNFFISDLESGKGSPKYFKYFVQGIRVFRKSDIYRGLKLKLPCMRIDKLTGKIEFFNHTTKFFEVYKNDRRHIRQPDK
jgi:hypothetical protein